MPRRTDATAAVLLVLSVIAGIDCSRPTARSMEVGRHSVRLIPPSGWEHLNHGREQIFRSGEMQVVLADLGPSTRKGMARELGYARDTWLQGHRKDALARVHELRGPPLRLATSHERALFWQPWYETRHDSPDSLTIWKAFEGLSAGIEALSDVSAEAMAGYALDISSDMRRREIARHELRSIHGADWTVVETWDRVSHLYPSRLASLDDGGYLLALRVERGPMERIGPVFDALLSSIEITAEASPTR